jgi:hypothetical protein
LVQLVVVHNLMGVCHSRMLGVLDRELCNGASKGKAPAVVKAECKEEEEI